MKKRIFKKLSKAFYNLYEYYKAASENTLYDEINKMLENGYEIRFKNFNYSDINIIVSKKDFGETVVKGRLFDNEKVWVTLLRWAVERIEDDTKRMD